jgi:hypothetical protein
MMKPQQGRPGTTTSYHTRIIQKIIQKRQPQDETPNSLMVSPLPKIYPNDTKQPKKTSHIMNSRVLASWMRSGMDV